MTTNPKYHVYTHILLLLLLLLYIHEIFLNELMSKNNIMLLKLIICD